MAKKSDEVIAREAALRLNQENAYRVGLELAERIILAAIKEAKREKIAEKPADDPNVHLCGDGKKPREFFITLPESEPKKGREHQEGCREFLDARVHEVGQIALPRGRKQIHTREVL